MRGTIVCEVADTDEGRGALELAAELSTKLGLRLVLVHVEDGLGAPNAGEGGGGGSTTIGREDAARTVARLAADHGVAERAEQRSAVGDPAALLGQIAAEEAADLIVVGSRPRGWPRRGFESRLARELETTTHVPVIVAVSRTRGGRTSVSRAEIRR